MSACAKCGHDPGATVRASWVFRVDREPPSLNDRVFNAGSKRWTYAKERGVWILEFTAARLNGRIPIASGKRRVTFTRLFDGLQRERDHDNVVGGGKIVVDAFVHAKLLVGDSPAQADIHWTQERGLARGLHVLIEELA